MTRLQYIIVILVRVSFCPCGYDVISGAVTSTTSHCQPSASHHCLAVSLTTAEMCSHLSTTCVGMRAWTSHTHMHTQNASCHSRTSLAHTSNQYNLTLSAFSITSLPCSKPYYCGNVLPPQHHMRWHESMDITHAHAYSKCIMSFKNLSRTHKHLNWYYYALGLKHSSRKFPYLM